MGDFICDCKLVSLPSAHCESSVARRIFGLVFPPTMVLFDDEDLHASFRYGALQ